MESPSAPNTNTKTTQQCGICLDPIKEEVGEMDSCSHIFCFTCIIEWAKVTNL